MLSSVRRAEARMAEPEATRRKEEGRIVMKEAMTSKIHELLNYRWRPTALPYATERQCHQMIQELGQSIDRVILSIWWGDEEMEQLDRTEYWGPGR